MSALELADADEVVHEVLAHMNMGHYMETGWGTGVWKCSCGTEIREAKR